MQPKLYKQYRANLHILSPIHVGTGEELDPFFYIIQDRALYLIDLIEWMDEYEDRNELEKMMDTDNFANIRSYIAEHFNSQKAVKAAVPIDCPKLINTYRKAIKERDPKNQVLVNEMVRNNITMAAIIPGSSIKGAIRTAIGERFWRACGVTSKDTKRGRFHYDNKIFGSPTEDPMKNLKITDVHLAEGKKGTVVVEAEEYPLDSKKSITPKGFFEVASSYCQLGKPIVYPLRISVAPFEIKNTKIAPEFIIESLNKFYLPKYEEEYKKFYHNADPNTIQRGILPISKTISDLKSNEALVRIGHFSHVECVTYNEIRKPATRRGKNGKPLPYGVTRTLANGIYPFGWAKIELVDLEAQHMEVRKWDFPVSGEIGKSASSEYLEVLSGGFDIDFQKIVAPQTVKTEETLLSETSVPVQKKSEFIQLCEMLDLVKSIDMGRIGTVIQKIETLSDDNEKGEIAKRIREKIGNKAFKKHKRKEYLIDLINKLDS